MPRVTLGNAAPVQTYKPDPSSTAAVREPVPGIGYSETNWDVPETTVLEDGTKLWGFEQQVLTVVNDTLSHHSDNIIWVESEDPELASALARSFDAKVGRPDNWNEIYGTPTPTIAQAGEAQSVKVG